MAVGTWRAGAKTLSLPRVAWAKLIKVSPVAAGESSGGFVVGVGAVVGKVLELRLRVVGDDQHHVTPSAGECYNNDSQSKYRSYYD